MTAGEAAANESERARIKAHALREQADRLENHALQYEKGRVGELEVAETLDRLSVAGFARIDDVRWPGTTRANIDHLIFGPTGFFVVDAKNWSGKVWVNRGTLWNGRYGKTRETDKVTTMASQLQAHLGPSVGICAPVLCLAGQPDIAPTRCGQTTVVGLSHLNRWIFDQREIWPMDHVLALALWLPSVLSPASGVGPVAVRGIQPTSARLRRWTDAWI